MSLHRSQQELQLPGAGLPGFENAILNFGFKFRCMMSSGRSALNHFKREHQTIFQIADDDESFDAFHPLLIPRVTGIEDSSRQWSVMMVLEHLCMVNRDMVKIIEALSEGIKPRGQIDVALYKPEEELDYTVLDRFREVCFDYEARLERLLEKRGRLGAATKYAHPWFGPLTAHQWHCLAAVHMSIHRRQIQKIVAMLGVV